MHRSIVEPLARTGYRRADSTESRLRARDRRPLLGPNRQPLSDPEPEARETDEGDGKRVTVELAIVEVSSSPAGGGLEQGAGVGAGYAPGRVVITTSDRRRACR